jgi:hypothetical protein
VLFSFFPHLLNGQLTERYSEILGLKMYPTGALVHCKDEKRQEVCYSSYDCHESVRIPAKEVLGMALSGKNLLVVERHGWKLLSETVAHLYDIQGKELDSADLYKGHVIMQPAERNGMLAFITQSPGSSMARHEYLFNWIDGDHLESTGLSYQPTNWVPIAGAPLIYAGPQTKHGHRSNPDVPAILGGQPIEVKRIENKIRLPNISRLLK